MTHGEYLIARKALWVEHELNEALASGHALQALDREIRAGDARLLETTVCRRRLAERPWLSRRTDKDDGRRAVFRWRIWCCYRPALLRYDCAATHAGIDRIRSAV